MSINVEIYENSETEEYDVTGPDDLFDDESFDNEVDAHAFAEEWQQVAKEAGTPCDLVWLYTKPLWA